MRVVAGRFGGRRLVAPRGRSTRPTSEKVREALFAMLEPVAGAIVLDLFAGTGALGIEALSRGARRVTFVERDRGALAALSANLTGLGIDSVASEVRPVDALDGLRKASELGEAYDLVLIDPPYRQATEFTRELSGRLPALLTPAARVVLESDTRSPLDLPLALERERRYGDTVLRIYGYRRTPSDAATDFNERTER